MNQILTLRDGWEEMVMEVHPILEKASNRGIPVDIDELNNLITYLETTRKQIYEDIQSKVPDEMRLLHPKEGYVRIPKLVGELWEIYNDRISTIKLKEGQKLISLEDFIAKKSYLPITKSGEETKIWGRYRYGMFDILNKHSAEVERIGRWCLVKDFNPNSSKQIISYMKAKKHKVPVKLTGEETSDAKELERLAISTGDLMYDQIIEYRQLNKMLTNDCPNWTPQAGNIGEYGEGAVHTEFGFLPASGQLNSRNPNVQNANKHKPLGKRFRRIVRARDSRRPIRSSRSTDDGMGGGLLVYSKLPRRRMIVELDYSGFHAIMLGREAQSERYINISKCDAHSWFTSYVIGKPVEYPKDFNTNIESRNRFIESLKSIKNQYKVIRDTQSKPTILGVGLGLGPKKMYWMNRPRMDKKLGQMVGIASEARSKQLQGILKELLRELFEYQDRIKDLAFRQTYLINKWGMIRWFFDVRGEDGEKAIAFNVQGNAHGMLRWVIRENEDLGYNEEYNFINTIHDSLKFEPWEDEVGDCISKVRKVMERPCLVLKDPKVCPDGLVVMVEASYGENWGEYHEVENPGGMKVWKN